MLKSKEMHPLMMVIIYTGLNEQNRILDLIAVFSKQYESKPVAVTDERKVLSPLIILFQNRKVDIDVIDLNTFKYFTYIVMYKRVSYIFLYLNSFP
tara:strand:+ start:267 stop:554 length:288 start_codon:yes stop_codon:yes gene_type:complete